MRLYLDVSCLNRPFDDQRQPRIRLEFEAIIMIFEGFEEGRFQHVASEMLDIQIDAITDPARRRQGDRIFVIPAQAGIQTVAPDSF